jgi:hypothetical protein
VPQQKPTDASAESTPMKACFPDDPNLLTEEENNRDSGIQKRNTP